MASLAELLLGKESPVTQFTQRNSGLLTGLGTSLLSDGMNFAPAQAGAAMDRQAAAQRDADAKLAASTNATKQWLAQKYPDLAQAVEAGLPVSQAWQEAFNRQNAKVETPKPLEINGQLVDPNTYQVLGDFRDPATGPAAPSGYRWKADGGLEFIPNGPADPAMAANKPPTDADVRGAKLSSVIQGDKELLLGANGVYDKLADPWSQAVGAEVGVGGVGVGRPGLAFTSSDYQSATNALTNIAQSYLYAISGQAAPAEEVAKIIESVTPKFGESADSVKNKKARLASYVAAIEASRYNIPGATGAGGATPPMGADADVENILSGLGI